MKKLIKQALKPLANFSRKIVFKLMRDVIEDLEGNFSSGNNDKSGTIKYYKEEKIRIMFLFQAASFWPSWESFYEECVSDERLRVEFVWLSELYGDETQMLSAKQFLEEKQIPYKEYTHNLFAKFAPHILVMQTPYDFGHRKAHVRSSAFKKKGTRIIYIPYGIEISDTEHARDAHFLNAVVRNAWKVFTFSNIMLEDYRLYCPNYHAIQCLGHPKFDSLYNKERFQQLNGIAQKVKGRKILVWHVHFPKMIPLPDGRNVMVTPELIVYLEFLKYLKKMKKSVFVILLPHPKFLDGEGMLGVQAKKIINELGKMENAYIDWSDDYRNTMLNGDFIITDRSALMIECAVTGKPILYMSNADYREPMTKAIEPIIESYYQGTTTKDMMYFIDTCLAGKDPKKQDREKAFTENIPYFDGNSGKRIKEHIISSLEEESEDRDKERIQKLELQIKEINKKIDLLVKNKNV